MAKLGDLQELMGAKFANSIDTLCKKCGELESACVCSKTKTTKARDSYFLAINEEKSGGKDITHCGIFYENKDEMQGLFKEAKKHFASGGKLEAKEDGFYLVLQGKHKENLKAFLKAKKFKFKK